LTVTNDSFRKDFPEFGDHVAYAEAGLTFWLNLAALMLDQNRWGVPATTISNPPSTIIEVGYELFAAHNLSLERRAQTDAQNGNPPGISQGPITSMSVGGVTVSYDTSSAIEEDAGHWNLTIYGTRFIHLARQFGAVGYQTQGVLNNWNTASANAWPGPWAGLRPWW